MEKLWKLIESAAPITAVYPPWAKWLFALTIILVAMSLAVFLILLPSAKSNLDAKASAKLGTTTSNTEHPTVTIEGPPSVPLGKSSYFTIISRNATRGVWSIGGFQNEPVEVLPLGPSHQIVVEPIQDERVGDEFTLVFTAYNAEGAKQTAMKRFRVVAK